jgi:hypothetical protein
MGAYGTSGTFSRVESLEILNEVPYNFGNIQYLRINNSSLKALEASDFF